MAALNRHYTRVAVVQLDVLPAAVLERRTPLEDPLFEFGKPDSLLRSDGTIPAEFEERFKHLRARIRQVYAAQLKHKLLSILAACRRWNVRLVVFPEYSIPYEILGPISDASGEMVIVAGTHSVERDGLKSGLYQKLGWHGDAERPLPIAGQAVCPVLYQGRLLALQPKLHAAKPEEGSLKKGKSWSPIELPALPSPMGVLICLDFLSREDAQHHNLVGEQLSKCRFLAVPSLTPAYTIDEFGSAAWTEARRYGRPVLYANVAGRMGAGRADLGGGSSIFVDEGSPLNLRQFPTTAGILDPGNEGVIVADVDLGYDHKLKPSSTHYDSTRPIQPLAAASLVYRRHPVSNSYANFVEQFLPRLAERTEDDSMDDLVEELQSQRDLLLQAGAFTGCEIRNRRLQEMYRGLDRINSARELEKFTSEVVLPAEVLSLTDLRSVLALSAADVLDTWIKEQRGTGLHEVEERLRKAGQQAAACARSDDWSAGARDAAEASRNGIVSLIQPVATNQPTRSAIQTQLPAGVSPATLPECRTDEFVIEFFATPSALRTAESRTIVIQNPMRPSESPSVVSHTRSDFDEELFWLLAAEEASDPAILRIEAQEPRMAIGLTLTPTVGGWTATGGETTSRFRIWMNEHSAQIKECLQAAGLAIVRFVTVTDDERRQRIVTMLPMLDVARTSSEQTRRERLKAVGGEFCPVTARATESFGSQPEEGGILKAEFAGVVVKAPNDAIELLSEWFDTRSEKTALLLGEFGTGKSTVLAEWAHQLWRRVEINSTSPRPVLCTLAGTGEVAPINLLLDECGLQRSNQNIAAVTLFIRAGLLLPIFDGFDEMATRVTSDELPERLASLLAVAGKDGRVVISSRDHYFPTEGALKSATDHALAKTLGASSGVRRLTLQLLDQTQVERFVKQVLQDSGEADEALAKIAALYPLQDLVRRPLLLGMVLQTRDQFEAGARISQAGLYEAYLNRWLEQTDAVGSEIFNRDQKKRLAEEIAWDLWKSGEATLSVEHLQDLIRDTLNRDLPSDVPFDAAFLEAFGGTFFVREGEDRFRFAHKSFLEFFLARVLVRTLPSQPQKMLDTRPLTREVCAFVGELLRRDGDWQQSTVVLSVSEWLRARRDVGELLRNSPPSRGATRPQATEAANALRLLLGLSRWAGLQLSIGTDHAGLCGVDLSGDDLTGVDLRGADLSGALLSGAQLIDADLTGAVLDDARLNGAIVTRTSLAEVQATRTDFLRASFVSSSVESARLCDADFSQSSWTNCLGQPSVVSGTTNFATLLASNNLPQFLQAPTAPLAVTWPRLQAGHCDAVNSVSWSPDGRQLASAGSDGTVRVWEAATGAAVARLEGRGLAVLSVSWSPNGRQLASCGDDGTVRVWDAATGAALARMEGHNDAVNSVGWSPDGQQLASGGDDGTVRVWDAATGAALARMEGHDGTVSPVSWSRDGRQLASGGADGTVRVWNAATGAAVARLEGHDDVVNSVSWSPDGSQLASSGADGTVRVWDAATRVAVAQLIGHNDWVRSISWSPDGRQLASGGDDGTLRVWDPGSGAAVGRVNGHNGWVMSVSWSPDGRLLVSGGNDGTACVWDAATGAAVARMEGHNDGVWSQSRSPDGRQLAAGGSDGTVRVWDAASGAAVTRLLGLNGAVLSVTWSPDGRLLAGRDFLDKVLVWEAKTGVSLDPKLFDHASWKEHADAARRHASLECSGLTEPSDSVALGSHQNEGSITTSGSRESRLSDEHEEENPATQLLAANSIVARESGAAESEGSVEPEHSRGLDARSKHHGCIPIYEDGELLATFEFFGSTTLARTRSGYFRVDGDGPIELGVANPSSPGSTLCLSLHRGHPLFEVLHRPDLVAAELQGLPVPSLEEEFAKRGWELPRWDGTVRKFGTEAVQVAVEVGKATASVGSPLLRPGPAIVDQVALPGRDALLAKLVDLVELKCPVRLLGPRRAGKTSLLHTLANQLRQKDWNVRIESLQSFSGQTSDELAAYLEPTLAERSHAAQVLASQFAAEPKAVLLLDEIVCLKSCQGAVFGWLRSLSQNKHVVVVYVATEWEWAQVIERAMTFGGSLWSNEITPLTIGPLGETAATQFLLDHIDTDAKTARRVVEQTNGWPFYLQVVASALRHRSRSNQIWRNLDESQVAEILRESLLSEREEIFEQRWSELPKEAPRILIKNDTSQIPPEFGGLTMSDLRVMRNAGLCSADRWVLDNPFFEWMRSRRARLSQDSS